MGSISLIRLITSVTLSALILYFHNLGRIRSYPEIFQYSTILLTLFRLSVVVTLSYFIYSLLGSLKKPKRWIVLFAACFLVVPLVYYTLNIPYINDPSILPASYLVLGNPLRDQYGINWYWMDWGVWAMGSGLYLLFFYLYIINLFIDKFTPLNHKKK